MRDLIAFALHARPAAARPRFAQLGPVPRTQGHVMIAVTACPHRTC